MARMLYHVGSIDVGIAAITHHIVTQVASAIATRRFRSPPHVQGYRGSAFSPIHISSSYLVSLLCPAAVAARSLVTSGSSIEGSLSSKSSLQRVPKVSAGRKASHPTIDQPHPLVVLEPIINH